MSRAERLSSSRTNRKLASVCLKLGRHGDFPLTDHRLIVDVLTRFGPIKLLSTNLNVVAVVLVGVGVLWLRGFSLSAPVKRNLDETANCG